MGRGQCSECVIGHHIWNLGVGPGWTRQELFNTTECLDKSAQERGESKEGSLPPLAGAEGRDNFDGDSAIPGGRNFSTILILSRAFW